MSELSIFVDESGDFGAYEKHAPYYIISMVMHDQAVDISEDLKCFEQEVQSLVQEREDIAEVADMIFELNTDNQAKELLEGQRRYREIMASQYAAGRIDAQEEYEKKLEEKDKTIEELQKRIKELEEKK